MAAASPPPAPPLLSWRGMQAWSVGCRVPSLCRMFVIMKARKLARAKRRKRRESSKAACRGEQEHEEAAREEDEAEEEEAEEQRGGFAPSRLSFASCCTAVCVGEASARAGPEAGAPHRAGGGSDTEGGSPAQFLISHLFSAAAAGAARRNSDASRLSTSSYERVSVEYGAGGAGGGLELPRAVKLGMPLAEAVDGGGGCSPFGGRHSFSQPRFSSSSSHSNTSSATSASALSARLAQSSSRLKDTYARISHDPHVTHLFSGNQFLTHLSAAPVPASCPHENARLRPSSGLVRRCPSRDADLKDRIIFFI